MSKQMNCVDEPVYKLFIQDLNNAKQTDNTWTLQLSETGQHLRLNKFQIQGVVTKITGFLDEILILSDKTGKAKVTRGPNVPGDFSWLKCGVYCSIIGTLLESGKLPHIAVVKLAKVENKILQETWEMEVNELKQILSNNCSVELNTV